MACVFTSTDALFLASYWSAKTPFSMTAIWSSRNCRHSFSYIGTACAHNLHDISTESCANKTDNVSPPFLSVQDQSSVCITDNLFVLKWALNVGKVFLYRLTFMSCNVIHMPMWWSVILVPVLYSYLKDILFRCTHFCYSSCL